MPQQNSTPESSEHGFGLMRGDLGLPPYAVEMLRVLYLVYLLRVHGSMRAWQEEGASSVTEMSPGLHTPPDPRELPDLDALTASDADAGIVHRYFAAAVDNGGLVLFVQRRADAAFQPGRWEIPTAPQRGGEHPMRTLDRALTSATGLEVDEVTAYLGCFDFVADDGAHARQHVFAVTVCDIAALHLGGDYEAHRWELANGTTAVVEDSVQTVLGNSRIDPSPRRREID